MTQTAKQKFPYAGGWLIREDESIDFDRASVLIDNSAGTTDISIPAGYPFKLLTGAIAAILYAAADVGNNVVVQGANYEPQVIRAGEKRKIAAIAKGLNVFNQDQLPTQEYNTTTAISQAYIAGRYVTDLKWSGRRDPSGPTAAPPVGGANVATGGEQVT